MPKTDEEINNDESIIIDDLEIENIENQPEEIKQFSLNQSKVDLIIKLLANIKDSSEKVINLLSGTLSAQEEAKLNISQNFDDLFKGDSEEDEEDGEGRIVEGVFDGENMIGPDGKQYSVPANYASKSKLVEGDILKLTITPSGTFVYKQIGPIERTRLIGVLEQNSNGNFYAISNNKKWRILTASVTYFKGNDGDEIVILIPKTGDSKWAAVENIVKKKV